MKSSRIAAVRPARAVEGGRLSILGEHFTVDGSRLPTVHLGGRPARVVYAASDRIDVVVPAGITASGSVLVAVDGDSGEVTVELAAPYADGLHQIDNPVFDSEGNLYVTFSGARGEEVPASIFRIRPDRTREVLTTQIVNPTSMAMDPDGRLYVSSRFDGVVYRLDAGGAVEPFVTEMGIACGLAFAPDGSLFVGDRSGTIFKVDRNGRARTLVSLPPSVAAFHLALDPGGALFVTGPTLSTNDPLYRIDPNGRATVESRAFGRPQGLAFDPDGTLHVVEALAGSSGVYRVRPGIAPELVLTGAGLVGLAFRAPETLVVCSGDAAYRFN